MKLQDYKQKWDNLSEKKNLSGKEALEAVKQDGYALSYVNEQTPEMCLEAVKQNGDALRFVNEDMFEEEDIVIDGKKFSKGTIKEALKSYIN